MRTAQKQGVAWLAAAVAVGTAAIAAAQDSPPVQVSSGASHGQSRPIVPDLAATSNGATLVVWLQPLDNQSPQNDYQLWGRVLDRDDVPRGGPFAISAAERDGETLSVSSEAAVAAAPAGRGFLVLWGDGGDEDPFERVLVGTHVGLDGVVAPTPFPVTRSGIDPDIAYNANRREYLAVWSKRGREIRAMRLRPDGSPVGDSFRLWRGPQGITYPATAPSVAYDSDSRTYLVAWRAQSDDLVSHVYWRTVSGRRKAQRGRMRQLDELERGGLPSPEIAFSPRDGEFMLALERDGKIFLARIDARGRPVSRPTYVIGREEVPAYVPGVAVTRAGDRILTYQIGPLEHDVSHVYYERFGRQLRLRPRHRISTGPYESYGPAVTAMQDGFGVAWIAALGPDDYTGPEYSFGEREAFFRNLSGG